MGYVLPTRVGMVHTGAGPVPRPESSPHTRGDGPFVDEPHIEWQTFSPHAWGWSARHHRRDLAGEVLPTRVGMVRCCGRSPQRRPGFPHTRGDGSNSVAPTSDASRLNGLPTFRCKQASFLRSTIYRKFRNVFGRYCVKPLRFISLCRASIEGANREGRLCICRCIFNL